MSALKRRPSANPVPDDLQEAFEMLPKTKTSGKLVVYKELNFKRAPVWAEAAPYRHTLLKILRTNLKIMYTRVAK